MKASDGFSKPVETGAMVVAMIASFWLLSLAMKELPLGTAMQSGQASAPSAR